MARICGSFDKIYKLVTEIGAIIRKINMNAQKNSPALTKNSFISNGLGKLDKMRKANGTTTAKTQLIMSFFDVNAPIL